MGLLHHPDSDQLVTLASRTLVGRSAACGVRSAAPRVSSEHAVIAWRPGGWTVRDLGSRNGTWVEDVVVPPGVEVRVDVGARLHFGGDAWTLTDAAPPVPTAIGVTDGARVVAEGAVLLLPDADAPLVSCVPQPDGTWRVEDDGDGRIVGDLDVIDVGGRAFRLHLPTSAEPTLGPEAAIGLRFLVSLDEERVEVEVTASGRASRLRARAHHYLLLTLARQRLADHARAAVDRGWVTRDDLARRLRVDPATVNVHLHRIRQDLGQYGEHAAGVVEVRSRAGQVRVATDAVSVERV